MDEPDRELHFKLTRKVSCNSNVENHKNIKFELVKESTQTFITGFTILFSNLPEDISKERGLRLAKNFTNYLSLSSGLYVDVFLDGIRVFNKTGGHTVSKSFTVSYCIENNANLLMSDEQLLDLMNGKNAELVQQLAYVNNAMNSLQSGSPVACIKDLVLACNENPTGTLKKFKSLRNALSHDPVYPQDIQNIQTDFGMNFFAFTVDNRFDLNSAKNTANLHHVAQDFLSEVRNDLIKIIQF